MPRPSILDVKILGKIAKNTGKDLQSVRVAISKKAHKLGISTEAAFVLCAKENNIGTSAYQRKLTATQQSEIRDAVQLYASNSGAVRTKNAPRAINAFRPSPKDKIKYSVDNLQDPVLKSRCQPGLIGSKNFDIPVNQATLVLEDRIRTKAKPQKKMSGDNLVGYAYNEELAKTVLSVASNDPEDQRGFTQILRGMVPAFRNKTHHNLMTNFSREEATQVCGFVDVLLRVVDNSVKNK